MPESPVQLVPWDGAAELGASVAVTTRRGGVSAAPYDTLNLGLHVGDSPNAVATNRERAATAFGVALEDMVFARQVHGTRAAVVGSADRGRGVVAERDAVPDTDILVTQGPDVVLVIMAADCVPIALVDSEARVLAAVHAGWRGTAAGAMEAALEAMRGCGARPERIHAFLGPAVDPDRYQVTDQIARAVAGAAADAPLDPAVGRPDGPGHWLVDLVAANRRQLSAAGVPDAHIDESGMTTAHEDLFSDRAQRPCGRFALLARLSG
jgi:purine-nucleoside/S-methyl-5'-thioadenosine phosphorylase / adenosine deaminase